MNLLIDLTRVRHLSIKRESLGKKLYSQKGTEQGEHQHVLSILKIKNLERVILDFYIGIEQYE